MLSCVSGAFVLARAHLISFTVDIWHCRTGSTVVALVEERIRFVRLTTKSHEVTLSQIFHHWTFLATDKDATASLTFAYFMIALQ
jgi:hypothetical protein